jgi:hypothetical protein
MKRCATELAAVNSFNRDPKEPLKLQSSQASRKGGSEGERVAGRRVRAPRRSCHGILLRKLPSAPAAPLGRG